jgi:formate dehydrogenase subunit gamma
MANKQKELLMFNTSQRFVHWLHTVAFVLLITTGAILYIPLFGNSLGRDVSGHVLRLIHRIGAVGFMLVPILYIVSDPKGWLADMKRVFTWGLSDFGWLAGAPRYYFVGDEEAMPPQDKFNTGQKLFYLVVVLCMVGFIVTGLIMWFLKGIVPAGIFQWSVFVHDLCTIAYAAFFLLHFMLAAMHPVMKGALNGMLFGWVSEEYVKQHHAKYYEELQVKSEQG